MFRRDEGTDAQRWATERDDHETRYFVHNIQYCVWSEFTHASALTSPPVTCRVNLYYPVHQVSEGAVNVYPKINEFIGCKP